MKKKLFLLFFLLLQLGVVFTEISCKKSVETPVEIPEEDPEEEVKIPEVSMTLQEPQHVISEYLTGVDISTSYDTDERMADGKIVEHLKRMKSKFLRWPDTGVCYHWMECPGAPAWRDPWETDPTSWMYLNDKSMCGSSANMEIDEFMALCAKLNAVPLVTVNFQSGWRYDRMDESLQESIALMEYCKEMGYDIKYWRIGNEAFDLTVEELADVVNTFAPAMKVVMPDIKIVVNVINKFSTSYALGKYQTFFELAGDNVDVIDLHWYWRHTNRDDSNDMRATWTNFLAENPITLNYKTYATPHQTADMDLTLFREKFSQYVENVMITEWNAGPLYKKVERSHYQAALMQCEMMMQFMKGNLFAASRWPGTWVAAQGDRAYMDPDTKQGRPVLYAMEQFAKAGGFSFLKSCVTNIKMPSMAAISADGKKLLVYLLNKNDTTKLTAIKSDYSDLDISGVTILGPEGGQVEKDGQHIVTGKAEINEKGEILVEVPAYSLCVVEAAIN